MAALLINNNINNNIININCVEHESRDSFFKTTEKEYCHLFFCEKHCHGIVIIGNSLSSQFNFELFPNFKEIVCCESNMDHVGYISFDIKNKIEDETFSDSYFSQFDWKKEDFLSNIYDKNGNAIEPDFELAKILAKDMINNYNHQSYLNYDETCYDDYESHEDYLGCSDYFDDNTGITKNVSKMITKPISIESSKENSKQGSTGNSKQGSVESSVGSSLRSSLRSIDRYDLLQDDTLYYNIFYDDKYDDGFIVVSTNELTFFDTTTYPGLKKITKNDFHIDYNGCIVKENNEFRVKFMHSQDYYDRSCGGWELEYFSSSVYDTDGNKIDNVPKELEAIFTN